LAYYVVQKTGTRKEARVQIDEDEGVVNLDRTRTLDEVMAEFIAGSWTLPAYARDVEGYYAHLVAPTRVLEDGPHGQKVAVYRETAPDHFAHAENYCRVALDLPRAMALPPQDGVQKGESWD
jgi:hypothetical protein